MSGAEVVANSLSHNQVASKTQELCLAHLFTNSHYTSKFIPFRLSHSPLDTWWNAGLRNNLFSFYWLQPYLTPNAGFVTSSETSNKMCQGYVLEFVIEGNFNCSFKRTMSMLIHN